MLLRAIPALLGEVVEHAAINRGLALLERVHRLATLTPALAAIARLIPHHALLIEDAAHRVEAVRAHRVHASVAGVNLLVPVPGDALHVRVPLVAQALLRLVALEVVDPEVLGRDVTLRHLELRFHLLELGLQGGELLAVDLLELAVGVDLDELEVPSWLGGHQTLSAALSAIAAVAM